MTTQHELRAYPVTQIPWPLEPLSSNRPWMEAVPNGNAHRCLPLMIANGLGWIVRCPVSFSAMWNGSEDSHATLFRFQRPGYERTIHDHFGSGIITFQVPWLFRTSQEGVGLLVKGASNWWKFNAVALEAFVETWWLPFTFTMNWKIMRPWTPVEFEEGDPICCIVPLDLRVVQASVPRIMDMQNEPTLRDKYQEWNRNRAALNSDPRKLPSQWGKHYQRGIDHSGGVAPGHTQVLRLPGFTATQGSTETPVPVPRPAEPEVQSVRGDDDIPGDVLLERLAALGEDESSDSSTDAMP